MPESENGMEDDHPCFRTNCMLDFAHGIYRKIFTDTVVTRNQNSEISVMWKCLDANHLSTNC